MSDEAAYRAKAEQCLKDAEAVAERDPLQAKLLRALHLDFLRKAEEEAKSRPTNRLQHRIDKLGHGND